jgi:single-strand DNA-binding protein
VVRARDTTEKTMAEGLNQVTLVGNLGDEPELKFTQNNRAFLKFRFATSESYADANGERKESTQWHNVVLFGNRAEPLSKMLHKGHKACVVGRIEYREFEKDGVKKYLTDIVALNIILLERRQDGQGAQQGQQNRPPQGGPPQGGPPQNRTAPQQQHSSGPPQNRPPQGGPPPARDDDFPY